MQKHFLCPQQQQWLLDHPNMVMNHVTDTLETGNWYRAQGQWREAIPCLGSAMEAAEIMLAQQGWDTESDSIFYYTASLHMLIDGLKRTDMIEYYQPAMALALARLQVWVHKCRSARLLEALMALVSMDHKLADKAITRTLALTLR